MLRVKDDNTDVNEVLDFVYNRTEISTIRLPNGIKMHGFFLTSDAKKDDTSVVIALET